MNRTQYVTKPDLRLEAYYFAFSATGKREIDEVLSAVACAGKAYHHTDRWSDSDDDGEPSYVDLIQAAATRAAAAIASQEALLREAVEVMTTYLAELDNPVMDAGMRNKHRNDMRAFLTKMEGRG